MEKFTFFEIFEISLHYVSIKILLFSSQNYPWDAKKTCVRKLETFFSINILSIFVCLEKYSDTAFISDILCRHVHISTANHSNLAKIFTCQVNRCHLGDFLFCFGDLRQGHTNVTPRSLRVTTLFCQ